MQRRTVGLRWPQRVWSALAVLPGGYQYADSLDARAEPDCLQVLTPGLVLELHHDKVDGYFDNWSAPRPLVHVHWRMQGSPGAERAVPQRVSVLAPGAACMLGAGEGAGSVDMPPALHAWLGACLAQHGHDGRSRPRAWGRTTQRSVQRPVQLQRAALGIAGRQPA